MKQIVILSVLAPLSMTLYAETNLRIGMKLPEIAKVLEGKVILTSPSSLDQEYEVIHNSVRFSLAVDSSGLIKYFSTDDNPFVTPEHVHVGQTLKQLREKGIQSDIEEMRGWGYFITLPSGWNAGFLPEGYSTCQSTLKEDSSVMWLFKSKLINNRANQRFEPTSTTPVDPINEPSFAEAMEDKQGTPKNRGSMADAAQP